ncbi:MAG: hypothetical protein KJO43_02465 [Phycisphaerae bacterium]|nr:hypothetical protein [Phycisphaerae bacterium]NNF42970.1 hypothetical protein [Phycisphaerales bacterium]
MFKKILLIVGVLVLMLVAVAFWLDVPRFVVGILTYGRQVREGTLLVGDPTPVVPVYELAADTPRLLEEWTGARPLVLIFGSFT